MQLKHKFETDWKKHPLFSQPELYQALLCYNYRAFRRIITHYSAPQSDLLYWGCGTAHLLQELEDLKFNTFTGVDLNENAIRYAQRRFPAAKFLAGDMASVNLPQDSVDLAFSLNNTFRHLLKESCIDNHLELTRCVLKPSGSYILQLGVNHSPEDVGQEKTWIVSFNRLHGSETKQLKMHWRVDALTDSNVYESLTVTDAMTREKVFHTTFTQYRWGAQALFSRLLQVGFEIERICDFNLNSVDLADRGSKDVFVVCKVRPR